MFKNTTRVVAPGLLKCLPGIFSFKLRSQKNVRDRGLTDHFILFIASSISCKQITVELQKLILRLHSIPSKMHSRGYQHTMCTMNQSHQKLLRVEVSSWYVVYVCY